MHSPTHSILYFLLSPLLTLSFLATLTHGQGAIVPPSAAAYDRMGAKLYVVGGGFIKEGTNRTDTPNDGQTLVLDLSVSWDAANPSWKRLKDGPKQMDFAAALSADGSKLVTFRSGANVGYAMIYDVATDTWSPSKATVSDPNRLGLSAVTDPTTNRVYLPFGPQMHIYDFNNDTMSTLRAFTSPLANSMYFRGAWWSKRQSIVYFGGYTYPGSVLAPNSLTTYTPSLDTWSTLPTTGTGPSSRSDMCMNISDDGETLIVYGGRITSGATTLLISAELYILNLTSMVWTLGNESAASRIYAVCTIYNGTFLSWGGSDTLSTVNEPVLVYNIKNNQYLSRYSVEPSPDLSGSLENEGKPDPGPGSRLSNRFSTGAIVGIFLGAALGTAFLVWGVRYNMEKRNRLKKGGACDEGAFGSTTNTSKPSGGEKDTRNLRSSVTVEPLLPYHQGYRPRYSHAPHENLPTSQNAPQNFSNDLPGYMMDHATRGPEGTPNGGHGNAGDTPFEDLRSWRDRQWNVRSVGSPHRLLEPETLRSPQR
ncbi:MAG: hypothetical protein J3Q66DRAFT_133702 [Benniella sp.]|nr:MAG: hypothetical protein J3Q66DRAFT_133702 [Benniella sp.]